MDIYHPAGSGIVLGDSRFLKSGRLRWLRSLSWMIGLFALVLLAVGPGIAVVRHILPIGTPQLAFLANIISGVLAVSVYALLVRFGEDRHPDELAIRPAPMQLAAGLALGAAMFGTVMAILMAFNLYTIEWLGSAPVWRASGHAIQAALIEETLVRAILFRLLWRAFGPLPAFTVSAAVFGVSHIVNPGATIVSVLCIALEAGIMLGALYALTGRLWVSIGVHAAWNFTQGYVFGAAVSGGEAGPALAHSVARPDVSVLLTGGSFGPEASLPALLVCTSVGVGTLWLAWKRQRLNVAACAVMDGAVKAEAAPTIALLTA
ncbi:CPBP family intramembrane metalloprotease [Sphingomonas sp. PL-96]|uniref:CPBP family intramembrane glutamic endopeptidase n=1 Tax=Sphingomonas sp. PL-96 TaxID=2887201 RepID=UPI001E2F128A|nr:CPBP family intramembrane glutamic endopeptidase [Sphingomonas sp. PL-96]MCC2976665.1 CPBP family intramembrane metalloprotease [Sphingomonas sp. PL-96]